MSTCSQRRRSSSANGPAIASARSTPPMPHTTGAVCSASPTRSEAGRAPRGRARAPPRAQIAAATSSVVARARRPPGRTRRCGAPGRGRPAARCTPARGRGTPLGTRGERGRRAAAVVGAHHRVERRPADPVSRAGVADQVAPAVDPRDSVAPTASVTTPVPDGDDRAALVAEGPEVRRDRVVRHQHLAARPRARAARPDRSPRP